MIICSTIFISAALSLHSPCPVEPLPVPHVVHNQAILASRSPRLVGEPQEPKSLRRIRRSPDTSVFAWDGGPYAL